MRSSANISAFAARKSVGPAGLPPSPEDLVPQEALLEKPGQSPSVDDGDLSESSVSENQNQFSVLKGTNTSTWTSPKRIFELSGDAVRVELSESQSIAVLGVYHVWVKSGEITILGARLHASPTLHKIYAPTILPVPQITAWSQKADFVLTSTYGDLCDVQVHNKMTIWDVPGQGTPPERSFHIVGYSFPYDVALRKRLRLLDLRKWQSIIDTVSEPSQEGRAVLVCGSGRTGKSTFCRVSTNQLLANQSFRLHNLDSVAGILLLDLDLEQPELTPPGLIYLAHVKSPLFGSPDSHYAMPGLGRCCLLRMHYLSRIEAGSVSRAGSDAIKDLIEYCEIVRKDHPEYPLLINSSSWLLDMEHTQLSSLISLMRPSDIVYFDSSGVLKYQEILTRSMGDTCNLWDHTSKVYRPAPATITYWSHMQSYFHLVNSGCDGPNWDPLAVLSFNKKELSYSGPDSKIWAFVTLGERLAPHNLAQALEDAIVAMVVVKAVDTYEAQANHLADTFPKQASGDLTPNVPGVLDEQRADAAYIVRTAEENLPYFSDSNLEAQFLHPRRSECLGLAYITAIDPEQETIEIVTPITEQVIIAQRDNNLGIVIVMGRQERRWAPTYR